MLIKQSKNSFIRCTEHYGYITNQLTRHDRVYDELGADFLRQISRIPRDVNDIVNSLLQEYDGVDYNTLYTDFMEFAESLSQDNFVVLGSTVEELEASDMDFTYNIEQPKTKMNDFYQSTNEIVKENTRDFFMEEVQGRPLISNIQFELSSRCNERCIHCYIPNAKKNNGFDMPTQKVKSILDEFSEMGGIHVTLSGGEVFLHRDLIDIIKYCREKDFKITILSNLISLQDEHIPLLKEANLSLVQTSLYSMNPNTHDTITTVKGSWERTKNAIEKLVEADIPVQISCPIMKANKNDYNDVVEFAHSLKIKVQTDFMLIARSDLDTENLANRLTLEETEEVIRDIIKDDIKYYEETLTKVTRAELYEMDPERFKKQPVCGVGYDNCCITANGDVYPCAGWQDYVLGNVFKQSLTEIWENSPKVKALRKITQGSFSQCLDCEASDYCARCLVRNYNESGGDMFKISQHFCDVAFLNKRLVEEVFGPSYERREKILEQRNKKVQ